MNVNELQFYPFINTYPSIQQTFSSIENWKKPEVSQSCYRSCRVVVEWSCVYWAFITVNRSVFASVNGRYLIYDILLCMCLHRTLFFLFKVRRARVIKCKPQGQATHSPHGWVSDLDFRNIPGIIPIALKSHRDAFRIINRLPFALQVPTFSI